jgi:hypothetical protein
VVVFLLFLKGLSMVRTADQEEALQELSIKAAVELRNAILALEQTFTEHARELLDLRPQFWMALGMLRMAVECGEQIMPLCKLVSRCAGDALGAPGDFGYGSPCGDALKATYDATNRCFELARAAGLLSD